MMLQSIRSASKRRSSLTAGRALFLLLVGLYLATCCGGSVQETATKHTYSDSLNVDGFKKLSLAGVGVRIKTIGPIRAKVYSVGLYLDKAAAASKLKAKFANADSKALTDSSEFDQQLIEGSFAKTLMLRMARDVGAEKMVQALAESVKPRLKGDEKSLSEFQSILSGALRDGGAKTDTVFRFESSAGLGKLRVLVNGQQRGDVSSSALVKALFATYLDSSAVSPTLKHSLAASMPAWLTHQ